MKRNDQIFFLPIRTPENLPGTLSLSDERRKPFLPAGLKGCRKSALAVKQLVSDKSQEKI